jgi:hypothetical protein
MGDVQKPPDWMVFESVDLFTQSGRYNINMNPIRQAKNEK